MKKTNLQKILTEIAKKLLEDGISFRMLADTGCHSHNSSGSCHTSISNNNVACHTYSSSSNSSGYHTSSNRSGHC